MGLEQSRLKMFIIVKSYAMIIPVNKYDISIHLWQHIYYKMFRSTEKTQTSFKTWFDECKADKHSNPSYNIAKAIKNRQLNIFIYDIPQYEWSDHSRLTQEQSPWGQHGAHLGPVGPRWAPCWPHEPCYQGMYAFIWPKKRLTPLWKP